MAIGVLLTCEDEVVEANIVGVGRTPIWWAGYDGDGARGRGYGSARRTGR